MKPILCRLRSGPEQIYLSNCEQVASSLRIEVATKLRVDRYRAHGAIRRGAQYIELDQYRPWINSRLLK
jgi:hypothetical protein